jgi:hypothetical protein
MVLFYKYYDIRLFFILLSIIGMQEKELSPVF